MIDLNQVSMRLKNSAYALNEAAINITMHWNDKQRLRREAKNNLELAKMIDEEDNDE
jgi:hypothetical protein|tara:strand:+ start:12045 stop:12215 length:171 start_codon:yes stop_codon:yes gene_type:complete